ncbi:hypothetical protein Hanom_Chr01g00068541 [Helianthus anomalus]
MSRKRRSLICSILTKEDLESFVSIYKIASKFSPSLHGLNDPANCTLERIVVYTLSFSFCDVLYPLSPFKMALLKHYGIHFSELHPLAFMRIVQFELSCAAFAGKPSFFLSRRFYRLQSDRDWFPFAKRKDRVSLPCYSFMLASTYPKEWKNRFIFVSDSIIPKSLLSRDLKAVIDGGVLTLSAVENMSFWSLLQTDCKGVSFVLGGVVNPDMGNVLEGKTPDVGSYVAAGEAEGTPSAREGSSERTEGSQSSPPVENVSGGDEDLDNRLSRKRKTDPDADTKVAIPEPRNILLRLRIASNQKSQPASGAASEIPPANAKGSLSKHLKTLRPSSSLVSEPLLVSLSCFLSPASSRAKGKAPEVNAAPTNPVVESSPAQATVSRPPNLS